VAIAFAWVAIESNSIENAALTEHLILILISWSLGVES
jgi:hypothetical protein